jgi:hypothetical protein
MNFTRSQIQVRRLYFETSSSISGNIWYFEPEPVDQLHSFHLKIISSRHSFCLHALPGNWFSIIAVQGCPFFQRVFISVEPIGSAYCCLSLQPISTCSPLGPSFLIPIRCCLFLLPAFFLHSTAHSASQALSQCTASYSLSHSRLDFSHSR